MRRIALAYAKRGHHVLPIYPLDENLQCTCFLASLCRSPGKHPLAELVPRGSIDATTDEATIMSWPEDGYNIGIACWALKPVIDIDDPAVAERLLAPEVDLLSSAIVARTGKGIHIYVLTTEPTRACVIKTTNNQTVGDLRALGQTGNPLFVVAPPSIHHSGKRYEWIGMTLLDKEFDPARITHEGTGYDYARQLLARIGVELRGEVEAVQASGLDGILEPMDIPFEVPLDAMFIRQMLSRTYPSEDRSDSLYRFACELYRVADVMNYVLDERSVARIVKKVDGEWLHGKGPKFANRPDGDTWYWQMAVKAQRDAQKDIDMRRETENHMRLLADAEFSSERGDNPPVSTDEEPRRTAVYTYDPTIGFVDNSGRSAQRICNFEPVIEEELEVWDGDDHTRDDWNLRMGTIAIRLRPENREDLRAFRRAISRQLPSDHIVEDRMWGSLMNGMQWYSMGRVARRRAYVAPGWLPDRDAFLLPGAFGAITPTGLDTSVTFEDDDAPVRMRQFGQGVVPTDDREFIQAAFRRIYEIAPPQIMVPLMTQILASTVASLGSAKSATIVHLLGRTGSYKTSIVRACLSILGRFTNEQRDAIDSWTGTKNSLQATFHRMRDLPVFLDDYKTSMFSRADANAINQIVQNAADRTARTRLGRDQREQAYLVARGLGISTGEDIWEGQESTSARTLMLDVNRSFVDLAALRDVQVWAEEGRLQSLGYEWIRWLTVQGKAQSSERRVNTRLQKLEQAKSSELGSRHPRIQNALASMMSVDKLIKDFFLDTAPEFNQTYREEISPQGWKDSTLIAVERADMAEASAPFDALREAINEQLAAGTVWFQRRIVEATSIGSVGSRMIGFVDNLYIYLSEGLTFGWYKETMALQRMDAPFAWRSFIQQLKQQYGAETSYAPIYVTGSSALRLVRIPRSGILEQTAYPTDIELS